MRFHTVIAVAAILLGYATSSSAQTVSLQFNNGRVTLNAQNAPIGQILSEWARVGGTRMVNHQRVSGPPVTLELIDAPERQALEVLLRTAAGYVVTAREGTGGASMFSGVVILATTSAARNAPPVTFNSPAPVQRPAFDDQNFQRDDQQQDGAALNRTVNVTPFPPTPGAGTGPVVVRPGQGTPTFGSTNEPSAQAPPPQRPFANTPQILPGTSRPGEITPLPPQQQQPPQAQQR